MAEPADERPVDSISLKGSNMSRLKAGDPYFPKSIEGKTSLDDEAEIAWLSAARAGAAEEAGAEIARQLNGPLTALLLYMGEIKQHSHQFSQAEGNRLHLQQMVENALQQTERIFATIKQLAGTHVVPADARIREAGCAKRARRRKEAGHEPLTRREREVVSLISEGYSNKEGALLMGISPRTFESHRAEAMRKRGARNTAELVRLALLEPAV
jgi:DNA-binding CsgD family transcriptional regulator